MNGMVIGRVQNSCQEFDAVDEARARSAEIGGGVDKVSVFGQRRRKLPLTRLLHQLEQLRVRPFNGKSAGHHDEDVRNCGQDLVPGHNSRGAPRLGEGILAAG